MKIFLKTKFCKTLYLNIHNKRLKIAMITNIVILRVYYVQIIANKISKSIVQHYIIFDLKCSHSKT